MKTTTVTILALLALILTTSIAEPRLMRHRRSCGVQECNVVYHNEVVTPVYVQEVQTTYTFNVVTFARDYVDVPTVVVPAVQAVPSTYVPIHQHAVPTPVGLQTPQAVPTTVATQPVTVQPVATTYVQPVVSAYVQVAPCYTTAVAFVPVIRTRTVISH